MSPEGSWHHFSGLWVEGWWGRVCGLAFSFLFLGLLSFEHESVSVEHLCPKL